MIPAPYAAPGSAAAQVGLIAMLERYERKEALAKFLPIETAWKAADQAHDDLLRAALNCGFRPGREDGHLSTLAWAQRKVGTIIRTMPNHVAEAKRGAKA